MIAAFTAFFPALKAGFSDFDDAGVLWLEDRGWQGLGLKNIEWMFTTFRLGHYHPLTYLTYALEWTLFGMGPTPEKMNPVVFHATNMIIHGFNAVVLWFVLRRILAAAGGVSSPQPPHSNQGLIAAGAALIWAVHPLRAESVAWITERRDVLSTFFLLLTTLAYLRAHPVGSLKATSLGSYAVCVLLLLLSLLSKAWGMTFFVVAVLLDIFPLRRLPIEPWKWFSASGVRVLLAKVPFAALGVTFAAVAAKAQSSSHQTVKTLAEWGVMERALQACYGLVFYVQKTLLPLKLCPLYELPKSIRISDPKFLVPMVIVAVAVVAVLLIARRRPGVAIAIAAYAILVAPVLGILQSGIQLVADRYSYISTIPLFALAAWGATVLVARAKSPNAMMSNLKGLTVVLAGLGGLMSWPMASVWNNTTVEGSAPLWRRCLATGHDGSLTRSLYADQIATRANAEKDPLRQQQLREQAIEQFRVSIELDATRESAWFGLGCTLRDIGRANEAVAAFRNAIEHTAIKSKPRVALGQVYQNHLSRPELALDEFEQAVRDFDVEYKQPPTGMPYLLLGVARAASNNKAGAVEMLERAAKLPDTKAMAEDRLRMLDASR